MLEKTSEKTESNATSYLMSLYLTHLCGGYIVTPDSHLRMEKAIFMVFNQNSTKEKSKK